MTVSGEGSSAASSDHGGRVGEEAGARMIVAGVCAGERVAGQRRFAREAVDGRLGRQRRTAVHRERTVQQGTSQMVHRDQQQHRHFLQF